MLGAPNLTFEGPLGLSILGPVCKMHWVLGYKVTKSEHRFPGRHAPDMSYMLYKEKRTSSNVVFVCSRRFRQPLYQAGYSNGRIQLTIEVRLVYALRNVKM